MKKLFRTLLAVMVAAAMTFTVAVFAACGPMEPNNSNPDPAPEVDTTIPQTTIDTILATYYEALELNGAIGVTAGPVSGTSHVNGKINLDGNADISYSQNFDAESYNYSYIFMRDWAVYEVNSYSEMNASDFADAEFEGVIDYELGLETLLGLIGEKGVELPEGFEELFGIGTLLKGSIDGYNSEILKLANAAGAVSEENGVVTVNINKTIYNMVRDVKAVISSLNGNTTVGDILDNETVKKYAQIVTELVTPQELIDILTAVIQGIGGAETESLYSYDEDYVFGDDNEDVDTGVTVEEVKSYLFAGLQVLGNIIENVQPDENSSTYDYLVKIINSQELLDEVNDIISEVTGVPGVGLTKKISEFTIDEILVMSGSEVSVSDVTNILNLMIEAYSKGITINSFSFSVDDGTGNEITPYVLSNAKIYYTYGSNGLTSQKIEADLSINIYSDTGRLEGTTSLDVDLTLNYKDTAYSAENFITLPADLPEIDNDFGGDVEYPGDIVVTPGGDFEETTYFNVAGNTLIYEGYSIFEFMDLTEEELAEAEADAAEIVSQMADRIYFDYDGRYIEYLGESVLETYYYIQEDNYVYVAETEEDLEECCYFLILNTDFVYISFDAAGISVYVYYQFILD